jgi:hypothetical protein
MRGAISREERAMSKKSRGLVQGTLEMLILKTLALDEFHGYAIAHAN